MLLIVIRIEVLRYFLLTLGFVHLFLEIAERLPEQVFGTVEHGSGLHSLEDLRLLCRGAAYLGRDAVLVLGR